MKNKETEIESILISSSIKTPPARRYMRKDSESIGLKIKIVGKKIIGTSVGFRSFAYFGGNTLESDALRAIKREYKDHYKENHACKTNIN